MVSYITNYGEGYEIISFGTIFEFRPKSIRASSFKTPYGQYNFYTPSGKSKCDMADYNVPSLIISSNVENIYMDNCFSCSNNNYIINTPYNLYIYYLLSAKKELLSIGYVGNNNIKNLSKNRLKNLQIPVPNAERRQHWIDLITPYFNQKNEKKIQIEELENFIKERMNIINQQQCEEFTLGSICDIWTGNSISPQIAIQGNYKVYNNINSYYSHNNYNILEDNVIIPLYCNNSTCVKLLDEKSFITNNCYSFTFHNISLKKFICYYLLYNQDKIYELYSGCFLKTLLHRNLSTFMIRIPKMLFILELETYFNELEILKQEYKNYEEIYNQYIQELGEEACPT